MRAFSILFNDAFSVCRGDQWSPAVCRYKQNVFSHAPSFEQSVTSNTHTPVIPSVAEESRGNELFLLPRGKVALLFSFAAARVK